MMKNYESDAYKFPYTSREEVKAIVENADTARLQKTADSILEKCFEDEKSGKPYHLDEDHPFWPAFAFVDAILDEPSIGKIQDKNFLKTLSGFEKQSHAAFDEFRQHTSPSSDRFLLKGIKAMVRNNNPEGALTWLEMQWGNAKKMHDSEILDRLVHVMHAFLKPNVPHHIALKALKHCHFVAANKNSSGGVTVFPMVFNYTEVKTPPRTPQKT